MTLTQSTIGKANILTFPERVVLANADTLRRELRNCIDADHAQVVLDLQQVNFIDSSGLSVLIAAREATEEHEGTVVLAGLTPSVRSLIELTRMHQIFDIYEKVELATAGLA